MAGVASPVSPGPSHRRPMRELAWFVAVAFAGAWTVGGIAYVALELGEAGLGIGVLMVAVAALVLSYRADGSLWPISRQIVRWRVAARWYGVALALPAVLVAAALVLAPLVGGENSSANTPGLATLLTLPLFILILGGPEEIGWRGYALPRLQARFSALSATLLLAAIWMVWHVPVLLVPTSLFADLPVVPYLVIGVASSVVYTWLYNSTNGSILLAMVLHGAFNLALSWMPASVATWGVLAGGWVVVAIGICIVYGPANLSRTMRHHVQYEDAAPPSSRRLQAAPAPTKQAAR
jgi:uncharacterized protein